MGNFGLFPLFCVCLLIYLSEAAAVLGLFFFGLGFFVFWFMPSFFCWWSERHLAKTWPWQFGGFVIYATACGSLRSRAFWPRFCPF